MWYIFFFLFFALVGLRDPFTEEGVMELRVGGCGVEIVFFVDELTLFALS